jgi:hypothetical protein
MPRYIQTLWDRSSREELGRSETSQGQEKVLPEWQVDQEEKNLVCFFKNITGTNEM